MTNEQIIKALWEAYKTGMRVYKANAQTESPYRRKCFLMWLKKDFPELVKDPNFIKEPIYIDLLS